MPEAPDQGNPRRGSPAAGPARTGPVPCRQRAPRGRARGRRAMRAQGRGGRRGRGRSRRSPRRHWRRSARSPRPPVGTGHRVPRRPRRPPARGAGPARRRDWSRRSRGRGCDGPPPAHHQRTGAGEGERFGLGETGYEKGDALLEGTQAHVRVPSSASRRSRQPARMRHTKLSTSLHTTSMQSASMPCLASPGRLSALVCGRPDRKWPPGCRASASTRPSMADVEQAPAPAS